MPGGREPAATAPELRTAYWPRAAEVAATAAEHLRLLNYYNRAFADGRLPPEKLQLAIERQAPAIFSLTQQLVPLDPEPRDAPGHAALVRAVDLLVRGVRAGREYARDGDTRLLAQFFVAAADAQEQLRVFVRGLPADAELPALAEARERVRQVGDVRIEVEETSVYVVVLGPFDGLARARAVAEALTDARVDSRGGAGPAPTGLVATGPGRTMAAGRAAELPYVVRNPTYTTRGEAEEDAAELRAAGLEARVETDVHHRFKAVVAAPPAGAHWREPLWQQPLNLLPSFVGVAAAGDAVYVASRDGSVQGWSGAGSYLWHRQLPGAISTLAAAAGGDRALLGGYDIYLLNRQGQLVWRGPFSTGGGLVVQGQVSADGQWMVARTANDSAEGRVHALGTQGYLWPTLPYIAAQHLSLAPSGSQMAIGSSRPDSQQALVISIPQGQRLHRYDLPGPVKRVGLSANGQYLAALTDRELLLYQNEPEALLWRLNVAAEFLHFGGDEGPVYVAGKTGLAAFTRQGVMAWAQTDVVATGLWASKGYLVVQVARDQLDVYRADGTFLGSLSPLAPILSVGLAADSYRLVVGDADRMLTAWQLP